MLSRDNYKEYLYKVYSSWLGKIIGIRLGAPVEGWDYLKIKEKYNGKHGYLLDYGIFAADDDSNGPLFFVRSLLNKKDITAEDIGNTFLNYIQEYSGFFWWGGVGVSSEHTAYENLKNGIKAPLSGSKETNGLTIAEQIGGQIFSDCWGYVSGYNPSIAKDLAIKASSVTHDSNGIEGGIFVAVAICLAMQKDNIYEVIDETLTYLNPELEYHRVMKDIINFYNNNPQDYELCFKYIRDTYGYDKYPGTCHIIPNASLMMMAMLYGHGDFDTTMEMLNNCGWDTDCNCGNVGSILGALIGVENIDEKWIKPINDIVNASSCVGSLNIQTVSESAKLFTKLAYKLQDIEISDDKHFDLPYASEGYIGDIEVDNCLKCKGEIYKYTYYTGKDIYDSRYDPEFSPTIYPGYTISVRANKDIEVFAEDMNQNRFVGINTLTIPNDINRVIHKIGFNGDDYEIYDIDIKYEPKVDYDFNTVVYDTYGPRYEGDYRDNIRGFVVHSGKFVLDSGLIGQGLITSGHLNDQYNELEWGFIPNEISDHYLLFNVEGYMHYFGIGFNESGLNFIQKDIDIKIIENIPIKWEKCEKIALKLTNSIGKIIVCVNGVDYTFKFDKKFNSLIGIYIKDDLKNITLGLKLR